MGWNGRKPASQMTLSERRSDYMAYRIRYLPQQIAATERKLATLRREAARYGMTELLEVPEHG